MHGLDFALVLGGDALVDEHERWRVAIIQFALGGRPVARVVGRGEAADWFFRREFGVVVIDVQAQLGGQAHQWEDVVGDGGGRNGRSHVAGRQSCHLEDVVMVVCASAF